MPGHVSDVDRILLGVFAVFLLSLEGNPLFLLRGRLPDHGQAQDRNEYRNLCGTPIHDGSPLVDLDSSAEHAFRACRCRRKLLARLSERVESIPQQNTECTCMARLLRPTRYFTRFHAKAAVPPT